MKFSAGFPVALDSAQRTQIGLYSCAGTDRLTASSHHKFSALSVVPRESWLTVRVNRVRVNCGTLCLSAGLA